MAWIELPLFQHARTGRKYVSDLTDAEWAVLAVMMPPIRLTGRPRTTRLHNVSDTILYMATTECQWWMLPNDFLAVYAVRGYFYAWHNGGLLDEMNCKLVEVARLAGGRNSQSTAGIIDSQSMKTTESGRVSGYDAGKRIKGRKHHIFADGGYTGPKLRDALTGHRALDRSDRQSLRHRRSVRSPAPPGGWSSAPLFGWGGALVKGLGEIPIASAET